MKKVIVIGAGPAGLTSAYELLKDGDFCVTILEESRVIGGISQTVNVNGNRMDIGGHRFFSKDDTIMDWWRELLPLQGAPALDDKLLGRSVSLSENGPDPEKEDQVMLLRTRLSRIYYNDKFFDYPVKMNMATIKNMGMLTTMRAGFSYLGSCIKKRKENNLEDFYINRFGKTLYSMFFESYTEKLWGRHPREISADWGAQRVKGLSIRAIIKDIFSKMFGKKNSKNTETSLIEQFWYPKYGPGQLWELVAKKCEEKGASIKFEHRVEKFICENGKIKGVVCQTPNGEETLFADYVISSMPIKDLIGGMDDCEDEIREIANNLPYRDFTTVGLLVDKLALKNKTKFKTLGNIVPDCWIYVQDKRVKLGRIQIFNNWSPYMVNDPQNTVWIGLEYFCSQGDELWEMKDEQFVDFAISELEKMGILTKENVISTHRERVKKAYPAYFDSYKDFDKVIAYLNTIDNLYCVGRNGQHRYNNMDHSMLTAIKTAEAIKNGTESKADIWSVNTEKEYHENKS
ncbi:MAG: NAD(P)/FAD-dependent oxidoreductase [Clostridia bacterium]|nr:NAD(P)/FAD-dependent oxidoreductase [Clostridia bacterium]